AENMPRLLLLNSHTKLPLLWRVLSNNFKDKASFSVTRSKDKIPDLASGLNISVGDEGKSKVLYWAPGESEPKLYDGVLKYDPLSKFVNNLLEASGRAKEEL
ncbi:2323_t:CDS:2, partial [Acaulospora colombiana]